MMIFRIRGFESHVEPVCHATTRGYSMGSAGGAPCVGTWGRAPSYGETYLTGTAPPSCLEDHPTTTETG